MATITYATQVAADARSAELWVAVLGRDKLAEDVTAYLYPRVPVVEEGEPIALAIPARDPHLDKLLREDRMTADEVAALVSLYTAWSASATYKVGDLATYGGKLYKCVQAHKAQADWFPSVVPALWTGVAPANVVPIWVQPLGAHDAYTLGAQVTYNGQVWRSTINANVWAPGVAGWVLV